MSYPTMMFVASHIVLAAVTHNACAESLYQESSYQSLASDRKALHRRGDLITVLIFEQSSASSAANTTAGRDGGVGLDLDLPGKSKGASLRTHNEHDGRGQTRRQGQVLAQLTVRVRDLAPNGDLLIEGEQILDVNNERQQIKVEGRVRRQDVSETNTVMSTRLADAKISYIGIGDVAERQRPSWWNKLLTWLGL